MKTLLGFLPLIAFVLFGVALGLLSLRGPRRTRIAVMTLPVLLLVSTLSLNQASPPCEDLLDGPCEQNWVSETTAVSFVLFALSLVAAVALAAGTAFVALRRRRSGP